MTTAQRFRLALDLEEWGAVAMGAPVRALVGAGLPFTRSARLRAWVSRYGSHDPRGEVRVVPDVADRPAGGVTHLVIGDCHAAPGQSLRRFSWLGRMIADLRPDVVVQIGDWYSLDSLCTHRTLADRAEDSTVDELRAGEMAVEALEAELGDFAGRKILTLGNHDDRIRHLSDGAPWLDGLLTVGDAHRKRGWEVVPFLSPARVDGILYQHYLTVRGGSRAISGKFHALRLLERVKFGESVVVGHSHALQWRTESRGSSRVHALVAGCYFEHHEDYAGEDNSEWWRGVCVLRNVVAGDYDLETWSMARIKAKYGPELASQTG